MIIILAQQPELMITLETAQISLTANGILCIEFLDSNKNIDLEEAKMHIAASLKLTKGKRFPALVDGGNGAPIITNEAKEILANGEHRALVTAEAIVVRNLPQRLIANFIMGLRKKKIPSRTFNNKAEALAWLEQFLD